LGPNAGIAISADALRKLTPTERSWLADVLYDQTIVDENVECSELPEIADAAVRLDGSQRNRERATYLHNRCTRWVNPRCIPERPSSDAVDVTWEDMGQAAKLDGRRIRLHGYLSWHYELPIILQASRWSNVGVELRQYVGGLSEPLACQPADATIEATYLAGSSVTLSEWRVVSAQ
jgi:hypothetical protein